MNIPVIPVITVATIAAFAAGLSQYTEVFLDKSAELKASNQVLVDSQQNYIDILNKDIFEITKKDFDSFNKQNVKEAVAEYKKLFKKEIAQEAVAVFNEYNQVDLSKVDVDSVMLDINKLVEKSDILSKTFNITLQGENIIIPFDYKHLTEKISYAFENKKLKTKNSFIE